MTSTFVPALAERDDIDSVTVLRLHQGDASTDYRREGPKVEVYYVRGQNRLATITGSFLDVRQARKLVAKLKPDVVHGQELGRNGDIAVRCSPNCVVTVHGMVHVELRMAAEHSFRDRLRTPLFDNLVRRVLRRAKVVISISKYGAEELPGLIRGTPIRHRQSDCCGVLFVGAVGSDAAAAAVRRDADAAQEPAGPGECVR